MKKFKLLTLVTAAGLLGAVNVQASDSSFDESWDNHSPYSSLGGTICLNPKDPADSLIVHHEINADFSSEEEDKVTEQPMLLAQVKFPKEFGLEDIKGMAISLSDYPKESKNEIFGFLYGCINNDLRDDVTKGNYSSDLGYVWLTLKEIHEGTSFLKYKSGEIKKAANSAFGLSEMSATELEDGKKIVHSEFGKKLLHELGFGFLFDEKAGNSDQGDVASKENNKNA